MSGVASMGSRVKLPMPTPVNTSVSTSISQRCAMANRMIFSSIAASSVVVRSAGLFNVRLHQVTLRDDHLVTRREAGQHLDLLRIPLAKFHRPHLVGIAHADK